MHVWDPRIELAEYLDEDGNFTEYGKAELEKYSQEYYREFEEKRQRDFETRDRMVNDINTLLAVKPDGYCEDIEKIVMSKEYTIFATRFNNIRDFRTSIVINDIEKKTGVTKTIFDISKSMEEYIELKMVALHLFRRIQLMCPENDILDLFNELLSKEVSVFFLVASMREAKLGDKGFVCRRLGEIYERCNKQNEASILKSLSQQDYISTEPSYLCEVPLEKKSFANTKVCFVSCVNDLRMYEECLYYINRLIIPDGVEVTSLYITDAKCMTAGYNEGMQSAEADIYIFVHQDVSIINPFFLEDIISIFKDDDSVGVVGLVGSPKLPPDGVMWHGSRVGSLYKNESVLRYGKAVADRFSGIVDVEAVDGLLFATSKHIAFREDIFDGWDFYDASICQEYLRKGYRVVVPDQCVPWVIHDDGFMNLYAYGKYREIFIKEYYSNTKG